MISLKDISFSYGSNKILSQVDLKINQPGFYGVLGPNGSGKTTLLKLLCGLLEASKGQIHIGKSLLSHMNQKDIAKQIAYVPQQFNLHYDFSIEEVAAMGRHPYHGKFDSIDKEERALIDHALKVTGLSEFRKKSITKLSGGELQRVIIARALVQDTPIILLDEPISHLDIHYQKEIIHLLKDIAAHQQKIVLCVLHDVNIGMNYCDQVYLIQNEKLIYGKPKEVMTLPLIEEIYNTKVEMVDHGSRKIVYW